MRFANPVANPKADHPERDSGGALPIVRHRLRNSSPPDIQIHEYQADERLVEPQFGDGGPAACSGG